MLSKLRYISKFLAGFSAAVMLLVALHGVLHLKEDSHHNAQHCTLCEIQALEGHLPVLLSFIPFYSYLKELFVSPEIHKVLSVVPHADLRGPPLNIN